MPHGIQLSLGLYFQVFWFMLSVEQRLIHKVRFRDAFLIMLSISNIHIRSFGLTDQGLLRDDNEDALLVDDSHRIYAVADGLGGLPNGAVASGLAIEMLRDITAELAPESRVNFVELFERINRGVFVRGHDLSEHLGIGTTLTAVQLWNGHLRVGHVGDTGVIVFNVRSWRQLTHDHTMAQEMIDNLGPGEHAYIPEHYSHTLTRCIGQTDAVEVDVREESLEGGERILIFSDGVTKTHSMEELHEMILEASGPESFVRDVIATANQRGGPDNTTAIALFLE